jgi:hypothetical protein
MAELSMSTEAAVRAADTLLRKAGGRRVLLRLPAPAVGGDSTEQLGLDAPVFQDVELWPVVLLAGNKDARTLLVSATAVEAVVGSLGYSAVSVLFAVAYGVLVDGLLMEVLSMTESEVGGGSYLYRLSLRVPATQTV